MKKTSIYVLVLLIGLIIGVFSFYLVRRYVFNDLKNIAEETNNAEKKQNYEYEDINSDAEVEDRESEDGKDSGSNAKSDSGDDLKVGYGDKGDLSSNSQVYSEVVNVEAVDFEPNSEKYIGFRSCDYQVSSCTVYGVESDTLEDISMGGEYILYFNETKDCKAVLGTAYCIVDGDSEVEEI